MMIYSVPRVLAPCIYWASTRSPPAQLHIALNDSQIILRLTPGSPTHPKIKDGRNGGPGIQGGSLGGVRVTPYRSISPSLMGRIDRRVNHNVRPECHCQLSSARGEIGGDNRVNSFDIECSNDREFDGPTPDDERDVILVGTSFTQRHAHRLPSVR